MHIYRCTEAGVCPCGTPSVITYDVCAVIASVTEAHHMNPAGRAGHLGQLSHTDYWDLYTTMHLLIITANKPARTLDFTKNSYSDNTSCWILYNFCYMNHTIKQQLQKLIVYSFVTDPLLNRTLFSFPDVI